MGLVITENKLSADIFSKLRSAKYFQEYELSDIEIALNNTLYSIVIYDDKEPIGMGRIVGDDRIAFFIKDVVVDSLYRKKGIGHLIMKKLLQYIDFKGCDKAYIGLMSTPGKESFYRKYGFIERPNEDYGHGMIKFLEKRRM